MKGVGAMDSGGEMETAGETTEARKSGPEEECDGSRSGRVERRRERRQAHTPSHVPEEMWSSKPLLMNIGQDPQIKKQNPVAFRKLYRFSSNTNREIDVCALINTRLNDCEDP
ncbi:hypothetical protein NDU88_006580 [Pleurodeles waltl]|uniref:Uncharacterized protein n=1 Tax=Pleurodeles waltl TaxID=8319 RepID=A0AAV7WB30_PLEWA|nr:hypothetical protein NDU88_006580 [Pleurodeles waltl]